MSLDFNTQSLIWIIVAAVALIVFIVWAYRQVMIQLTQGTGWWLSCLRIGAAGLLLVMLCEPAASIVLRQSKPANFMVLIDSSDSMSLSDKLGNRADAVTRLLSGDWFSLLDERYDLSLYQFSETVTPIDMQRLDSLSVQKQGTDIGGALEFVGGRAQIDPVSGVILITDGNHTVGPDPLRIADRLKLPVYAIGVGDTLETRDVAIVRHLTNDIAYVESKVPIEVTLRSQGIEGARVPVTLQEGDRVLDRQVVTLTGGGREQSVVLYVIPSEAGIHQYIVSIPEQADEQVFRNNRYPFSIKVLKSKLRILYIEGKPRPDITFLRQTLERDPNVEIIRLMARPSGGFYPEPPPNTQADWFQYDLIILGSIRASVIQPWAGLIVSFVEQKGGGLIALGGTDSFEAGGYGGTAIGNMLPVQLSSAGRGLLEGLYLPVLTSDGQAHPLMRLDDDPVVSMRLWAELPPLPGVNQTGAAKPGATVLARHSTWQVDGKNAPVIAIQRYGLGKVLAIATYDIWRWDLLMWGTGQTNAGYERFWSNAVRWMTTREDSQPVRVASSKTQYRSGEPIEINAQVYDDRHQPIEDASIMVSVTTKTEGEQEVGLELRATGSEAGWYRGVIKNLPVGEYTFVARATQHGRSMGMGTGGFSIGEPAIEYDRTTMNREMLERLAVLTNGRFYHLSEAGRLLDEVDIPEAEVTHADEIRLWNHPVSLMGFILLLTVEWLIRRRYGLL